MENEKQKIIDYLEKHPDTNNFELSVKLNIPIKNINKILYNLKNEKMIILY